MNIVMILTGEQIGEAVKKGDMGIDPFRPENLKGASYTFTLDRRLQKIMAGQTLRADMPAQYEELMIADEGYVLKPGEFVIGYTAEKLGLNKKFSCIMSVRSSCAKIGLAALQSDLYCEPDTDQQIALAISNVSKNTILLLPDMLIVKGIFFKLS